MSTSSSSQSTAICLWLYLLPDIQSLNSVIPFVIQDFFCFSAAFNIIIYYCLEIPSPWILWHTWLWSSLSDYCLSVSFWGFSSYTFLLNVSVYQSSSFCLLFSCNISSWVISKVHTADSSNHVPPGDATSLVTGLLPRWFHLEVQHIPQNQYTST